MKVSLINSINNITAEEWNGITTLKYPFIRHEFLHALEKSACVSKKTGWIPQHCLIHDQDELIGIMPLYKKAHSYGEFVFDHQWANFYKIHGLSYYPKWLTAIPFTPCEGKRLYVKKDTAEQKILATIFDFITNNAHLHNITTWHCLYNTPKEAELCKSTGLIIRQGIQFRWGNGGYRDFKDYLDIFNAKKRKKLLRERRFVTDQKIALQTTHGKDITEHQLHVFFQFYQLTYLKHGTPPYLNFLFFQELLRTMPEQLLLILAIKDDNYVGAAFSLLGNDTLYGRYWGCHKEYHSLHFEACYYQGIEYCIKNKLQHFDPGAQGEHKIARGFKPEITYSAHWIKNTMCATTIKEFTQREASALALYRKDKTRNLPFKTQVTSH
ncbi:COGs COG3146 [uncultured Candidatus Thioglobus sp.]|nr:COGs COG3146 [uncultured Candidatus Thioglobus sp.]